MAQQKKNATSGGIGTVVTYVLNGKQVIRSKPKPYKRTAAMKKRSGNFAIASTISSKIRSCLGDNTLKFTDNRCQSRLTGMISKWLGTVKGPEMEKTEFVPWISNFRFNPAAELNGQLKKMLEIVVSASGQAVLSLSELAPNQIIIAAPGTKQIKSSITAISIELEKRADYNNNVSIIDIPFTSEKFQARDIDLGIRKKEGQLLVVILAQQSMMTKQGAMVNSEDAKFNPIEVIAAIL